MVMVFMKGPYEGNEWTITLLRRKRIIRAEPTVHYKTITLEYRQEDLY